MKAKKAATPAKNAVIANTAAMSIYRTPLLTKANADGSNCEAMRNSGRYIIFRRAVAVNDIWPSVCRSVEEEVAVIEKLNRILHYLSYSGLRLLLVLYFVNQREKWVDAIWALDYGILPNDFYRDSVKLERLGLLERKRLNIKSYVRITERGRRLAECLLSLLSELPDVK
jgi:hypothetical protein